MICLAYNIGYRDFTGYTPSALINVSSLIFGVNLVLLLIGMLYFVFIRLFGKRDIVFITVFVLLTLFLIWKANTGHRFEDYALNQEWKGLILGVVAILGVSASVLRPGQSNRFFIASPVFTEKSTGTSTLLRTIAMKPNYTTGLNN